MASITCLFRSLGQSADKSLQLNCDRFKISFVPTRHRQRFGFATTRKPHMREFGTRIANDSAGAKKLGFRNR